MCLRKVTERRRSKNDDMVVGYKVFRTGNRQINGSMYGGPYSKGKVYHADPTGSINGADKSYQKGFHIYANIEDARLVCMRRWRAIYEVHGWDIRAVGVQGYRGDYEVIVAKHMRIIRRVK